MGKCSYQKMLMFIVTVLLLITTASAKGSPVSSAQHIGTVATYGEETFTIWNGDLYCGYEKAETGGITWVICQEDVLLWSKLDGDEADIYYKRLPFGDKAILYHAPTQVESFDIVNNELYYLYDGSIIRVNLNSEETLLVASKDFAEGFYLAPDKSLRYVEKTYADLFPDVQEDYSGYQELWFPDFRGENATLFGGGTVSADFISNSTKRQYIENAISYYLATYSSLTETLGNNRPVVFFFEGGSDNCDASGYNWSVNRTGAACVVIRYQQGTETPYIAYHSENCSTIPDYPLEYDKFSNGMQGYGTATLIDGFYDLYSVNHKGDYASYQVRQNGSAYVPAIYMKNDGSYSHHNASGINTHTRTMRNVSSAPSAPWSAGCFLIGSSTPFNEYNGYVEAINNGKSNIFTTTYRGYSIDKFSNTGYYAGKIVVDRYLATDALIGIYGNRNAVTDLTTFSSDNKTPAPTPIPDPPIIDVGSNYKVGDTVTITWNPVENASSYSYYVTEYPAGYAYTDSIKSGRTTDTHISFNDLPNGEYSVFIHAHNAQDAASGQSNWTGFSVYQNDYIPAHTIAYNGHLYILYDYEVSWSFARTLCDYFGGHLVSVTSAEENEIVKNLISQGAKGRYWLGATNADDSDYQNGDTPYRWITGEPFQYNDWASGEPNKSGEYGQKEHFAQMIKSYGWNDASNTYKADTGFILEIEPNESYVTASDSFNGNSYLVIDKNTTWTDAKSYCELLGGHLVTFNSDAEREFVNSLLQQGGRYWYYLGASKESGSWTWIDGTPGNYIAWNENEPAWNNTYLMVYKGSQDSVSFTNAYFPPTDISSIGFVCEIEQPDSPTIDVGSNYKVGDTVTITWNPVENASSYSYYVTEYPAGYAYTDSIKSGRTTDTHISFNDLPNGEYSVFIHAHNARDGASGQSNWMGFSVYQNDYIPSNMIAYNGHLYILYDYEVSWSFAKTLCDYFGGHLVSVTSAEENEIVKNLISQSAKNRYWLGATNADDSDYQNGDTPYRWITGETFQYNDWASGEPNKSGEYGQKEHFAQMIKSYGWNDASNTYKTDTGFILEIEPSESYVTASGSFNGNSYLVIDKNTTWTDAKSYCELLRGHLVTFNSDAEREFVNSLLQQGNRHWYYLGASKESGSWTWIDGTPGNYIAWNENEPAWNNPYLMVYKGSQDSVSFNNAYFPESDIQSIGFVCEIDGSATDTPKITVESKNAQNGAVVEIPVTIQDNPGIAGATLTVSYDKSALTLNSITKGSLFGAGSYSANPESGVVQWYHTENATGDGVLFTLSFQVKPESQAGDYNVSIGLQGDIPANLTNQETAIVAAQFVSGTLTVTANTGILGDVTGDGVVAINDVVKLARAVAGSLTLTETERTVADVTGDGVIAINDVVKLARYVAGSIATLQSAETASLSGGESAVIEVATVSGNPGETVRVPVSITSNPGIAGLQLDVRFDNGLTLKNIVRGDILSGENFTPDVSAGRIQWYDQQANVTNTGVLFTLEFEIGAEVQNGDAYAVTVNVKDGITANLSDYDFNPVNAEFKPGKVQIAGTADNVAINRVSRNGNTIATNIVCADSNASVFCAVYNNNGKMIAVRSAQITSESNYQFQFDGQQFDYAKAFIVDGNFRPLCESKGTN